VKPFTLLYTLLAALLYLAALPLIVFLSFKPKYRRSLPARFFLYRNPPLGEVQTWFHVCSLGEARALAPVMERLGGHSVGISVITHTGFAEASKYKAAVRYLPYEIFLPFWASKARTVVVLEAEFWYLLFAVARAKGAKLLLLNARISERSYPKYLKLGWFYRRMLGYVDTVYCQSEADRKRFLSLGARRVHAIGNIKLAQRIEATAHYAKPSETLIVAASTHEGEEEAVIAAYLDYAAAHPARLAVVPRHPERFARVWELIAKAAPDRSCGRWSEGTRFEKEIVLVDTMGELNNIYAVADIAVLGGAFRDDVGGHNPLEPARFGCKIISGANHFHQKELFRYVRHVQIVPADAIAEALRHAADMPPSSVDESIDLETFMGELL